MSDKMITPDEYLIENPTHMIYKDDDRSESYYGIIKSCLCFYTVNKNINWTGYTEPHVMIGPDFPQSRKREVKWGKWRITQDKVNKGDVPFQRVELPDGGTCFRIGQYIDEPVKSKPELSRFLPDGCVWKCVDNGVIYTIVEGRVLINSTYAEYWHSLGLLHPSEGGGFQKHKPGDPMPCDGELRVDVIDTIGHIDYGDKADSLVWDYWYCQSDIIGWRPHYEEQN